MISFKVSSVAYFTVLRCQVCILVCFMKGYSRICVAFFFLNLRYIYKDSVYEVLHDILLYTYIVWYLIRVDIFILSSIQLFKIVNVSKGIFSIIFKWRNMLNIILLCEELRNFLFVSSFNVVPVSQVLFFCPSAFPIISSGVSHC